MTWPTATDVRTFWFGPEGPAAPRTEWFRKDPAFDETVRLRFGGLVEAALNDAWPEPLAWDRSALDRLARVLVLDQFPRNLYRGSPKSFAGDARALALAARMVDEGDDTRLAPLQRWFVYLPFEHAEDLAAQERGVALFEALAREHGDLGGALDYAVRHRDVIRRFGRFPHRNDVLGRPSSPQEMAFLREPGSGF